MKVLLSLLATCLIAGCTPNGLPAGSVECKGKFQVSIVGPAGASVTGDCGDGASFTITRTGM